jgi:hypothetical protein
MSDEFETSAISDTGETSAMSYAFETSELGKRVVSLIVCTLIAMFLGTGALVFTFVTGYFLVGGILTVVFIAPIIVWRIVYSLADKNIHKRIAKSTDAVTAFAIVESCDYIKNSKKDGSGAAVYRTSVLTGADLGDKLLYRLYESAERFRRGDFVQIKFIKEQYNDCLIVRKAVFDEYKKQYPADYWDGYSGDGGDLLDDYGDYADDTAENA